MLSRRQFAIGALGLAGTIAVRPIAFGQEAKFDFDAVVKQAEELSRQKYQAPDMSLPKPLADLDVGTYREIRMKPEVALWHGAKLPFEAVLMPRGASFTRPVSINKVTDGKVEAVVFSPEMFSFPRPELARAATPTLGFAGFRLEAPLNIDGYYEDVLIMPGGSSFQAIGRGQVFGLSARALAVDTGLKDGDEPLGFRDIWLVQPKAGTFEAQVYALLEGESLTGAYRLVLRPGDTTEIDVSCRLFPRRAIRKLGLAPISSMFLHGDPGSSRAFDDWRPAVHDSDGLLMETGGGEWIWRPLRNPRKLRLSTYQLDGVRGFGLMQRDRDFRSYEDLSALYQQRPSLWIEPLGSWGGGRIELVELPSDADRYDNILAYWVPANPVEAGKPLSFDYRLAFGRRFDGKPPSGRVAGTYTGAGPNGSRRFVVDFIGGRLGDIPSTKPVSASITASHGKATVASVVKNQVTGGWRAVFDLVPDKEEVVDLRAFLRVDADALTETWSYQWSAS